MGIPLFVTWLGIHLGILLPLMPAMIGKAAVIVSALIAIAGLYYMLIIPGWQPGQVRKSRKVLFIRFGVALTFVLLATAGYLVFS